MVTWKPGKRTLEFPPGKALVETTASGWIGDVRISSASNRIAFIEHRTNLGDNEGSVCVVDGDGRKRDLAGRFSSASGLAWAPSGKEIWFTASESGMNRSLRAVPLAGKGRSPTFLGITFLNDVSADGRVLMSAQDTEPGDIPLRCSNDGNHLFVRNGRMPVAVYRISLKDATRSPWTRMMPADAAGVSRIYSVEISADGDRYVYSFLRTLSTLYLIDGP